MKKKILATLLATTLVLSLTACGGSGKNSSSKKDSAKNDFTKFNVISVNGNEYSLPYDGDFLSKEKGFEASKSGSTTFDYVCKHCDEDNCFEELADKDTGKIKEFKTSFPWVQDSDGNSQLVNKDVLKCDCVHLYGDIGIGNTADEVIKVFGEPNDNKWARSINDDGTYNWIDYTFKNPSNENEYISIEISFSVYKDISDEPIVDFFDIKYVNK